MALQCAYTHSSSTLPSRVVNGSLSKLPSLFYHRILSGFSPILHLSQADIVKIHNWTALPHPSLDVCVCMLCVCLFVSVCVCACQVLFQCAIASRKSSLIIQELLMSWIFIKFWAWFDFIAYFTLTSTPSAIKAITTTTQTSRILRQWPGYTQCTCKSFNELLLVWYTACAVFCEQLKPEQKYGNI